MELTTKRGGDAGTLTFIGGKGGDGNLGGNGGSVAFRTGAPGLGEPQGHPGEFHFERSDGTRIATLHNNGSVTIAAGAAPNEAARAFWSAVSAIACLGRPA